MNTTLDRPSTAGPTAAPPEMIRMPPADAWAGAHRALLAPLPLPGALSDMLLLMGMPDTAVAAEAYGMAALVVPVWRAHEGAVLLHEGDHAHTLYVVRSGSIKTVRTKEDGYEQVLSFVQPGGLVGVQTLHGGTHPASAVALEDSTLFALSAAALNTLQRQCPLLHEALWRSLSRQLVHAAEAADMMAAVASDVRLARFLVWMSQRMAEAGQSPRRLHLRMSRRDIASLLGVAHETVSRSFTQLVDKGLLRVDNRDVDLLDLPALRRRARSTRGWQGQAGAERGSEGREARRAAPATMPTSWWGSLQPAA
jgi:CRP/FNR family transcriptional regulator, anaerobic regulatory protein